MGSGSNVDVCVLTKGKVDYLRNYIKPNVRKEKEQVYKFKLGVTRKYLTYIYNIFFKNIKKKKSHKYNKV